LISQKNFKRQRILIDKTISPLGTHLFLDKKVTKKSRKDSFPAAGLASGTNPTGRQAAGICASLKL